MFFFNFCCKILWEIHLNVENANIYIYIIGACSLQEILVTWY